MSHLRTICAVVVGMTCGLAGAAEPSVPTVSATGHATVSTKPDTLRLTMLIKSDGADIKGTAAALIQQREDLKKKLIDLGAMAGSITFTDPQSGAEGNLTPQQQQMQMIMMARGGGKKPATSQPVTVSTTVKAEWPFSANSPDDALVAADALETKIKAVLPGAGKKAQTPEEQELAEEMAGMNQGNPAAAKPGEPTFLFVHKLSAEEQSKLTADAIAHATADATRLAAAAQRKLGPILMLSSSPKLGGDEENPYTAYIRAMTNQSGSPTGASESPEASGPQPASVSYTVDVSMAFCLN